MNISPDKQNIDRVFSNTVYYIDFYQRDYRWAAEPVLRLLDDLFHKFDGQYARSSDLDPSKETIATHYPWYYLNTYVTNVVDGRVYVVDGQQ
ncbi:GmrSD restriction endonuclease domain-containing protein, partial [Nitrosomonas sp. ANs5]|uniref:GmrSD restriction endonuclease domain-containing protein n=1 Tax=Nitrosomonas sp. ANs5 TaxID=3423941 RepID=UPI003D3559F8